MGGHGKGMFPWGAMCQALPTHSRTSPRLPSCQMPAWHGFSGLPCPGAEPKWHKKRMGGSAGKGTVAGPAGSRVLGL